MADTSDRVARIQAEWARERPDLDVSPQGVIGRLHRLATALTEELTEVYRRHGLSEGDFDVLAALRRAGRPFERTAGELAATTMVTTGGTTKRLDRLEGAGLLVRRPSPVDGRGRVVALTDGGRELIDEAFTEHMANEHRLVAVLGVQPAHQLEGLLMGWLSHFEEPAGTPTTEPRREPEAPDVSAAPGCGATACTGPAGHWRRPGHALVGRDRQPT